MAKITVSEARTLLENAVDDNLPEVSDDLFLSWMKFINRKAYNLFYKLNTEDEIGEKTYNVVSGTSLYATLSDYKHHKGLKTGVFKTKTGSTYGVLKYDAETGAFTAGETLTGGTSGATATIDEVQDDGTTGYLTLSSISGTFEDDETITDSATGSATANGTVEGFDYDEPLLTETAFGSPDEGFWLDGSNNLRFTPENDVPAAIYVFRYIKKLTNLTGDSSETVFNDDDETEEVLQDILVLQYETWHSSGASGRVVLSDQVLLRSLNQLETNWKKVPQVYTIN